MNENKIKVGVLNMQFANANYGAVLQAAALANTLEKLGCEVEHINFLRKFAETKQKITLRSILQKLKKFLLKLLKKRPKEKPQTQVTGQEVFENFRIKWLKRSPKTFLYSSELKKYKFDYDAVIVGSDQVWRWFYTRDTIKSFFLDFIHAPAKKISYAASFGLDYFELDNDNPETLKIKDLISKFSAISVREKSGVKICKETFGVNAIQVLDPTLLADVEFFNKIIETENLQQEENYSDIACCMLDYSELLQELLLKLQEKKYSTNIIYPMKEIEKSCHFIPVASWLKKIKETKFVITDSFHCVCMALLFEKNFVCIANPKRGLSRLDDLLSDVDLKNRIVMDNDNISKVMALFDENIQYDKAKKYFEHKREDALRFLKESLFGNGKSYD